MNITLSICIPTFNRIDKLVRLLDILKLIQHPAIEILVSDDSTNDDTENYFLVNKFDNIKYYRNFSNMGQFKNCNACIARAKGEWIQILHDDDDIDPSYIATIFPYLSEKTLTLITGNSEIIELGKNQGTAIAHQKKLDKFSITYDKPIDGLAFKNGIIKHGNPLVFSHIVFRRESAISSGGFDTNLKFIGDLDLWLKLLEHGDILFLRKKIGSYYLHDSNQLTTIDSFIQQSVELMVSKIEMFDFVEKERMDNYSGEYKAYINNNIHKILLLSSMIRNRNKYANFSYIRLLELYKNKKNMFNKYWMPKSLIFNGAYLISILFPEALFNVYVFFKRTH